MTLTLFIALMSIQSLAIGLITEAVKQWYRNDKKTASPNIIALIDSIVVGGLGTAIAYILWSIPFTLTNVICLILMIVVSWLISMLGYDKIAQTIEQITKQLPKEK